jgi:hypothetical protein
MEDEETGGGAAGAVDFSLIGASPDLIVSSQSRLPSSATYVQLVDSGLVGRVGDGIEGDLLRASPLSVMPERPTFVGPTNVQLFDPSSTTENPHTTGRQQSKRRTKWKTFTH